MQNTELVTYIQTELQKGVPSETIREALVQAGWQEIDINNALISSQGSTIEKPSTPKNKIWTRGISIVFILSSVLTLVNDDMMMVWFFPAGLGVLVVIGYFLKGIFRRKMSYIKEALHILLILAIVGLGTCVINLTQVSL